MPPDGRMAWPVLKTSRLDDAFRGEVREVEAAALAASEVVAVAPDIHFRGRYRAAVQRDEVERRTEATHCHLRAFAVLAIDRHARDALQ